MNMNYPKVLGNKIAVMSPKRRSLKWFEQQPERIRNLFWRTLAKFGASVAAEYLQANCAVVGPAPVPITKERNAEIIKAFSNPLIVSGTVIGKLWPHGVDILLPVSSRYYSYSKLTPNWAYIGVTTCKSKRVTYVSCDPSLACQKARQSARRFVRNGSSLRSVKAEMFKLRLEVVEMVGKVRRFEFHGLT